MQLFSYPEIWSQFEKRYFEQNEWIMRCSGFLIQRFGLCLREAPFERGATSYMYVSVLLLIWFSYSDTWSPF